MHTLIELVLDVAAIASAVILVTMTVGWALVSRSDDRTPDFGQRGHK